ncbi:MAG: hypothetical protein IT306_13575 [Chloroflexi bacterium]|nr:hypothetical protein [Chloroflexota bacterium]
MVDIGEPYEHMGALICDAGLQPGVNYLNVVWPRIENLMKAHPSAATTSGFLCVAMEHGLGQILSWSGSKKLQTIAVLTELLHRHGVETVSDLRVWLSNPQHLEELAAIVGIGRKTVDYIQLIVGLPAVAVDVHIAKFVEQAGINASEYQDIQDLIVRTAALMGISSAVLDHSIWMYMSSRRSGK